MVGSIVPLTIQGGSYVLMGVLALVLLPGLLSSGSMHDENPVTTPPGGATSP